MTPLRDLPHAVEVLAAGADLLDRLELRWWLSAGTALGVYRDGALIPHDTDLDVGVLVDDGTFARMDAAFHAAGFRDLRSTSFQRAYLCRDVIFDVYAFRREGGRMVSRTDQGTMAKPAHLIDNAGMIEFAGRSYPIPTPADAYLRIRYGEDWRTPKVRKRPWHEEAANLA